MLLLIHFVLASIAVLMTANGMLKSPVTACVKSAPFAFAVLMTTIPSPLTLTLLSLLGRYRCPQRPHIVMVSALPVSLRLTIQLLKKVPTLPGPGMEATATVGVPSRRCR